MTLLPKVKLGSQGLEVTSLGFGCMGLTSYYGGKMEDDAIVDMLEKVYANGVNFWDTANNYIYLDETRDPAFVCQEEKLALGLDKVGRENVVMATKTGVEVLSIVPSLSMVVRGDGPFIRQQCEDSLRRLKVDCLDLFYIHRIDQTIPIEITMLEMKKLVAEGKVKYVGLSECSASTLRRAHKVQPISCVQMEYSLWSRGVEDEILPTCKELGIGLVAYSPLGRGFFGGVHKQEMAKNDLRNNQPRFKEEENLKMYEKVEAIANEKGVTPAQLALAWVLAQQHRAAGVVPIPGTTKEKNLLTNIAAAKLTLTPEELATLEAAVPKVAKGLRYPGGPKTFEADENVALTPEQAAELGL